MKRIGILTAGGDTPALNATLYGAVRRANALQVEVYGFIKGFNSLFNPRVPHVHLNPLFQDIPNWIRNSAARSSPPRATTSTRTRPTSSARCASGSAGCRSTGSSAWAATAP
jgi:hypothetical protein